MATCNNCDFSFSTGSGYVYAETEEGKRIHCGNYLPRMIRREVEDVRKVLGFPFLGYVHPILNMIKKIIGGVHKGLFDYREYKPKWWWSKKKRATYNFIRQRTGYNSLCVCLDCKNYMYLDLGYTRWGKKTKPKDKRQCDKCLSQNVKVTNELTGEMCPECKKGVIIVEPKEPADELTDEIIF